MKTLKEIVSAAPDSYIEGGFEANVSGSKTLNSKSGKTFFKATLSDGEVSVDATSFSQTFSHWDGKRIKFYGMGIKRGADYNGKAQVSLGDRVKASLAGEGNVAAPSAPAVPAKSADERLADLGTLYGKCISEARKVCANNEVDEAANVREIATSFFIQATRENLR